MNKSIPGGPDAIRAALHQAQIEMDEDRYLQRLYGLLLVAEGRSGAEVGRWFGVDPHTVTRWVRAFARQGLEGLRDHHLGGRPTALSVSQLQELRVLLRAAPASGNTAAATWTGKRLQQHLAQHAGIALGVRQCQRLLRKLEAPAVLASPA